MYWNTLTDNAKREAYMQIYFEKKNKLPRKDLWKTIKHVYVKNIM